MLDAVLLGAAAQSSLILSGLVVYGIRVPTKVIGALAGFGAGALVAAIAFDLIPESEALDEVELAVWLLVGAATFILSDRIVEARFGGEETSGPAPLGIVVGSVVDGVPESVIFGIQIASGQPISIRIAIFATFDAGRLTSLRAVIDTFDLVEQALGRQIHLPKIA